MDFRKSARPEHKSLIIEGTVVEKVSRVKFLRVHLAEDLSCTTNNVAITKKAQQRLHPLRKLRKAGLPTAYLTTFYKGMVESILTYNYTSWIISCTEHGRQQLNRVVKTASRIVGAVLPSLIFKDTDHPFQSLLSMLPSGKRLRSIRCRTSRLLKSFLPEAVRALLELCCTFGLPHFLLTNVVDSGFIYLLKHFLICTSYLYLQTSYLISD